MALTHEVVLGRTQTGKTYYAIRRAQEMGHKYGVNVMFFDTKGAEQPPSGWVKLGPQNTLTDVLAEPFSWYVPSSTKHNAEAELTYILRFMLRQPARGKVSRIVIIDEAQVWAPSGAREGAVQDVARMGAGQGLYLLATAQRPADLSKQVLTQSERVTVFQTDAVWEGSYWKSKVPEEHLEQITAMTQRAYHYAVIKGGEVRGPFVWGRDGEMTVVTHGKGHKND